MYKNKSKKIRLKEEWLGWPKDMELDLIEGKADDLINREVAEEVTPDLRKKRITAPKNRAIRTDGKPPVDNTG